MDLRKAGKFLLSDKAFVFIMAVFIITMAIVTCYRGGKDIKVGLYGVEQTLQKHSPYDNPTDGNRPIFRYAPGFTILQSPFLLTSKMTGPFEFEHIIPSVFTWYVAAILAFLLSLLLIVKLIPAGSAEAAMRNLKISVYLALPLIAYELSNSQNKLIALAFVLFSVYLFEKKRYFLSAIFLSLAVTVYIPLVFFGLYFILRSKGRYIIDLALGGLVIFIVIPSVVWGIEYNNFVLKDWFVRCLKPFFMTTSYNTYMELRPSSQSLPSAIGRLFVWGQTTPYKYLIGPEALHIVIRLFSTTIIAISLLSVWRSIKPQMRGLSYSVFLLLALLTPSYCIWYTWAYLFVMYFATLNYISYDDVPKNEKKIMIVALAVLLISSYSTAVGPAVNQASVAFWGTLFYWACAAGVLLKHAKVQSR
ncbi:MAG: glycosyltransferase family 87 protein [Candidatus Omnitrophica bacterium]|nr:glycosyltransferase family 87 protein [Candidatus Omnitrophota bacterium]